MEEKIWNKAKTLLDTYHQLVEKPFPVDMKVLASLAGIQVKEKYMLDDDCAGQLIIQDGKVFAFVNIFEKKQRQNFTVAHEIAHTFFDDFKEVKFRRRQIDNHEEEALCDQIASELLIPISEFQKKLKEAGENLSSLVSLSKYFDASLEAIAVKFSQSIDDQNGVILFVSDFHNSRKGLRITNVIPLDEWTVFIPTGFSIRNTLLIDSFFRGENLVEEIELDIGPLKGCYHIETLPTKFQRNGRLYNKGYIFLKPLNKGDAC